MGGEGASGVPGARASPRGHRAQPDRRAGELPWPAYRRWRRLAGPLADYVLPSPFLAPWASPPRLPRSSEAPALAGVLARWVHLATAGAGAVVFLETTPRLGLAVGLRLGRAGWAVAPLYGRWPAPRAVLPAERLTGWLVGVAEALEAAGATPLAGRLCLLLDAERARPVAGPILRRRFDNRYDYPAFLLPLPARLLAWGTGRALWAGPAAAVPPDLQEYAESLVRAGITLELVSLSGVGRPEAGRGRCAP